jgi:hypothetical protein
MFSPQQQIQEEEEAEGHRTNVLEFCSFCVVRGFY